MQCQACNAEVPIASRFCNECGALVPAVCVSCGALAPPAAKFCAQCGGNLSGRQTEVAESPFVQAAERRYLSVMFCDMVGSTEISARLDPEDLGALIQAYQNRVATTVHQYGGFIARHVGDGVLIYFGWPKATETDAEQAIRAALVTAREVSGTAINGERVLVRIGIATGLVVIGGQIDIGGARHQAAIGETPNRAARLQALAQPNSIIIDRATRQQVRNLFDCRELGALSLKGLPQPVWAFEGPEGARQPEPV